MDWLQASSALTLIYAPDGREYHREVTVSFLTKTELKLGRWLYVPASFACLTPWYLPTPLRLSMTKQASNAMRYPFRYAGSLIYGSSSAGSMTAEISPDGHYPAALRFEYSGAAVDPVLTLRGSRAEKFSDSVK